MDYKSLVKSTLATPLGEMIAAVGEGVAEAQAALDEGSLRASLEIYSENEDDGLQLLRDIGYRPTFYTLPETTGELTVALNVGMTGDNNAGFGQTSQSSQERSATKRTAISNLTRTNTAFAQASALPTKAKPRIYAKPVNAGYTNRFNYTASASAKLTFKIVPVPPPLDVDELRTVPNLVGETVSTVASTLKRIDLEYEILNLAQGVGVDLTKTIKSQNTAAATIVKMGTIIGIEI